MYDITIGTGEAGKAENPQIISSGGMGPCISIGIYDPITKRGYMRHQNSPDNDSEMEDFIIKTLTECFNANILDVYVAGGAEGKFAEGVLDSRIYVEELLLKYFDKDQIKTKWSKYDTTTELILNCKTGKFKVVDCDKAAKKEEEESDEEKIWNS